MDRRTVPVTAAPDLRPAVHSYGPAADQFLELTLPRGTDPAPVVVVLHGGFWRAAYGVDLARRDPGDRHR